MRRLLLAAILALLVPAGAHANIQFVDNPGNLCMLAGLGGGCEANILFQTKETGATITGQVDHTGFTATFNSLSGQVLNQQASGQADITCTAGGNPCPNVAGGLNNLLTSIEMRAEPGTAWGDVLINLMSGTGTALVTVTDQMGATFQDPLKKGQNFLGMIASNGEVITDIQVTNNAPGSTFGWEEFKQPRVSGLCTLNADNTCTPVPVPEPGAIALLGLGLVGLGVLRRATRKSAH